MAHSLELAARESVRGEFQYIVTLNADMIPADDFSKGFDFASLVRLELTDDTAEGGILGFRITSSSKIEPEAKNTA